MEIIQSTPDSLWVSRYNSNELHIIDSVGLERSSGKVYVVHKMMQNITGTGIIQLVTPIQEFLANHDEKLTYKHPKYTLKDTEHV